MIAVSTTTSAELNGDTLLCFIRAAAKGAPEAPGCPSSVRDCLQKAWEGKDFAARKNQVFLAYGEQPRRIMLVGLGEGVPDGEQWRLAGGAAVNRLMQSGAQEVSAILPDFVADPPAAAAALAEGLLLASYRFEKYRSSRDPEEPAPTLKSVAISGPKGIAAAVRRAATVARAVAKARDMANEPGNGWTPEHFVGQARSLAKKGDLRLTVLGRKELEKLGMGGIIGVNQGSARPPRLVILEYRGAVKTAPTLLLVGKGLTFDSGGISLKPGSGMEEMKYDMCGGAAVLAAMEVVARERPKGVNVVAMVPATENMPGPAALKPGDIIRQYGGKSVEVINTDAEGRLILADALAYGVEKFRPAAVIDLATLTGAVIIALGHHRAGLLGNDDHLCERVLAAGERAGEPSWRLPLGPEYRKQLKSKVADLKNVDKRDAGTILAAAFLQEFVGNTPWVHLDIAGTAWNFTEKSYIPKGPSGFGVRTLVELIRSY